MRTQLLDESYILYIEDDKIQFLHPTACLPCQKHKSSAHKASSLLVPLSCPERPFERVGLISNGPLPKSAAGHRWIVTVVDHLARFVEAAPLISAGATDVADFLVKHIVLSRHGVSKSS